jgi:hypothetical protein
MARDYTRVYTEGAAKVHLLDALLSPNQPNSALCGRSPNLLTQGLWHGTGSQEEHERARDLQLCVQCAAVRDARDRGEVTR